MLPMADFSFSLILFFFLAAVSRCERTGLFHDDRESNFCGSSVLSVVPVFFLRSQCSFYGPSADLGRARFYWSLL